MTVKPILTLGDPRLRLKGQPVDSFGPYLHELLDDLAHTMRDAPGVGLAAPQIDVPLQLVVIEDNAEVPEAEAREKERVKVPFHVLVNPTLTVEDPTPVTFYEGCLSVTGFAAKVPRARAVRVEALDERGQPVTLRATGWYARILQHECDHLDGALYVDRMDPRSFSTVENLKSYPPAR